MKKFTWGLYRTSEGVIGTFAAVYNPHFDIVDEGNLFTFEQVIKLNKLFEKETKPPIPEDTSEWVEVLEKFEKGIRSKLTEDND